MLLHKQPSKLALGHGSRVLDIMPSEAKLLKKELDLHQAIGENTIRVEQPADFGFDYGVEGSFWMCRGPGQVLVNALWLSVGLPVHEAAVGARTSDQRKLQIQK